MQSRNAGNDTSGTALYVEPTSRLHRQNTGTSSAMLLTSSCHSAVSLTQ